MAYLTADQLDRHGPAACTPRPMSRSYVRNYDGSNPMRCDHSGRRIDPATGICGHHYQVHALSERCRRYTVRFDGYPILVLVPAHPYPSLQEAPPS